METTSWLGRRTTNDRVSIPDAPLVRLTLPALEQSGLDGSARRVDVLLSRRRDLAETAEQSYLPDIIREIREMDRRRLPPYARNALEALVGRWPRATITFGWRRTVMRSGGVRTDVDRHGTNTSTHERSHLRKHRRDR